MRVYFADRKISWCSHIKQAILTAFYPDVPAYGSPLVKDTPTAPVAVEHTETVPVEAHAVVSPVEAAPLLAPHMLLVIPVTDEVTTPLGHHEFQVSSRPYRSCTSCQCSSSSAWEHKRAVFLFFCPTWIRLVQLIPGATSDRVQKFNAYTELHWNLTRWELDWLLL